MLTLRIKNTSTFIDGPEVFGDAGKELKPLLRERVGFRDEAAPFRAMNIPGYDGMVTTLCYGYGPKPCKCAVKKDGMHFPSGLVGGVAKLFNEQGIPYQIQDLRAAVGLSTAYSVSEALESRDYQIDIVDKSLRWGRGLVKLATGGGKTGTAARLIAQLGAMPFIFFVPSTDLMYQAQREFTRFIRKNGMPVKVGMVGGGHRDIQDITVMTIQTARLALDPAAYAKAKEKVEQAAARAAEAAEKAAKKREGIAKRAAREKEKARLQAERIARGLKPLKKYEPTEHKDASAQESLATALEEIRESRDEDDEIDGTEAFEDLGEYRARVRELVHTCKGFIADEVQHWASKTCQLISDHAYNARYRYGFSATPKRDMGDDMLIDACFGGSICDINASYLIDRGYLVPPSIYFVPVTNHKNSRFEDYVDAYAAAIVENQTRNSYIANIAKKLSDDGRMVLILVKHIEHGEILESMIPGAVFVHGSHSSTVRDEHLEAMRRHKAPITIASTIFDEGIDVRPLDAVILAGGGKSQTRALQRIGRAIRPYSCDGYVKRDAIIIDFYDDVKWLRGHSNKRRLIYSTEPRFVIKDMRLAA